MGLQWQTQTVWLVAVVVANDRLWSLAGHASVAVDLRLPAIAAGTFTQPPICPFSNSKDPPVGCSADLRSEWLAELEVQRRVGVCSTGRTGESVRLAWIPRRPRGGRLTSAANGRTGWR